LSAWRSAWLRLGSWAPRGRQLVTLEDAAHYIDIAKLPKVEHEAAEWQAAMEALILVATRGGPTMMARIGVVKALNRNVERVFMSRKDHHWGKRKPARDRWNRVGAIAPNLPESQSHFAFVDALTSTTPYFRLIAVSLNHWLQMGRIFQLTNRTKQKPPSVPGGFRFQTAFLTRQPARRWADYGRIGICRNRRPGRWLPGGPKVDWVQIGSTFALRSADRYAKRLKLLVWKGGRVV
jgi:hypothetical protein